MRTFMLAMSILVLSLSASAEDIPQLWRSLHAKYFDLIQLKKYDQAIEVATKLNGMDPANTEALLFIVFSSVKAHKPVPEWVLEEPWAQRGPQDIFNRQVAEQLANGS